MSKPKKPKPPSKLTPPFSDIPPLYRPLTSEDELDWYLTELKRWKAPRFIRNEDPLNRDELYMRGDDMIVQEFIERLLVTRLKVIPHETDK